MSKRMYRIGLFGVVATALLAASLPQPELPACAALVRQIDREFYERYEGGTGAWSDLDPLIAEAHRCFGDIRSPEHARVFNYETSVLVKQRRFAEAEAAFERFFNDYAGLASPSVVAVMHRRRGYVYERLGWTVAMLVEFSKAAALVDQLAPADAASTLRNVGEQYRLVNDLDVAQEYFARAESLLVHLYAEDPAAHGTELGIVRLRQANVALEGGAQGLRSRQETAEAALPLVESALALIPATPDHAFYRNRALVTLAEVHWAGGRPEEALSPIAEAQRLTPFLEGTYAASIAMTWRDTGHTHLLLGDYATARAAYLQALKYAQAGHEQVETMRALVGLGEVLEAAAGPEGDLYPAEHYYRQAVALAEQIRQSYGTHDWSASAWATTQVPHLRLTRVLLRQGQAAEAFLTLDETRARYLRDLRSSARLRAQLSVAEAARLDSLSTALDSVRARLGRDALDVAARSALEAGELALQQRIDAIVGPVAEATPLTLAAVQRALQARGQVLLTYFLDDDLPTAFVVRADTFAAVPLDADVERLQEEVMAFSGAWAEDTVHTVGARLTPLHTLYQALYAPVAPLVPDGAPLVVVLDAPLGRLPFGLLLERPHPPFAYADAPYLLRRHPITVELAAALLTEPAPTTRPALDLLALGRSRFGATHPQLADLPGVPEELRRLRRHIGNARFALNEDATEAFFDAQRGGARVIHLASHALVNPQLPLYSRIVLWDDREAGDDGTLHLYELYDRPLNADLVTLSGCFTAGGRHRMGEGMLGLQHAFRSAGARATLATLWKAEDAAMTTLMDDFYQHLRRGLPKDEALRRAQLDYLDAHEGAAASPFFWAAPVLYGDPAPVALVAGAPSMALWLPGGLLLVLAGLALPRFTRLMQARRSGKG